MFEGFGLVVLLLPIGFALGWYVSRQQPLREPAAPLQNEASPADYFAGFESTAAEDADASLAALVRAVEVDDSTVDLHLTLGSLFRKRGEVDRALRLHQNVLSREGLDRKYVNRAKLELAYDYQKSGLLDHAEQLLNELADAGVYQAEALGTLISIFEQSHDWEQAVGAARRLQAVRGESMRPVLAHYHCELAEQAKAEGDLKKAEELAEHAHSEDRDSVRSSFVLGAVREARQDFRGAIVAYRRVPDQDLRFFRDILPSIERAYQQAGDLRGLRRYLEEAEQDYPSAAPSVAIATIMSGAGEDAAQYLAEKMSQRPSWSGLHALLREVENLGEPVRVLRAAIEQSMQVAPRYRCTSCGLTPRLLFWQCPSCKTWSGVVPVPDDIRSVADSA